MDNSSSAFGNAYLDEVVAALWPNPARRVAYHRRLASRVGQRNAREYVVVPSAATPKLLIPRTPRRVAAKAVRNYDTGGSRRKQLRTALFAAGVRAGLSVALPDRLRIEYDTPTQSGLPAFLSELLGRPVDICLYIGPARAVRKPVLQLLDADGTTLAFAKLGLNNFTDGLVRAETENVEMLSKHKWISLSVPQLIHSGLWQGHAFVVQSAFGRGRSAAEDRDTVTRAMDELARCAGVTTAQLGESSYWKGLCGRIAALPSSRVADLLTASVHELGRHVSTRELEFGSWHGDWAPWNMTVADGRAQVWDWEKFGSDVPIGFDAAHYAIQSAIVIDRLAPETAFVKTLHNATAVLGPLTTNRAHASLIVWLYSMDIAARFLEDREGEVGATRPAQLDSWVPAVLHAAEALHRPPDSDPKVFE